MFGDIRSWESDDVTWLGTWLMRAHQWELVFVIMDVQGSFRRSLLEPKAALLPMLSWEQ